MIHLIKITFGSKTRDTSYAITKVSAITQSKKCLFLTTIPQLLQSIIYEKEYKKPH